MRWHTLFFCLLLTMATLLGMGLIAMMLVEFAIMPFEMLLSILEFSLRSDQAY